VTIFYWIASSLSFLACLPVGMAMTTLVSVSAFAYTMLTDPDIPIVGNWARTYQVNDKYGDASTQMEIYSIMHDQMYTVYYYREGQTSPYKKIHGEYLMENPLLSLRQKKRGPGNPVITEEIWKDCKVNFDTLSCTGYHRPSQSFARWYMRPDKLETPCCGTFK
jgi:hypothetical protein